MKKSVRVVAASLITLTGLCAVLTVYELSLSNRDAAERDFISYCAAGWTTPAWLAWYLYSTGRLRKRSTPESAGGEFMEKHAI